MPRISLTNRAIPLLLIANLSLQGGAALAKGLLPEVGTMGVATLRVVLAALVLLLVFRPNLRELRQEWPLILPYGLALGIMNVSLYASFNHLPLGLAVTLEFLGPLLLATFLSRRLADYLWVGLAGLGILLITPLVGAANAVSSEGIVLALIAAAAWAGYIVAGQRIQHLPSSHTVTAGMVVASVITLPFGAAQAGELLLRQDILLLGLAVAVLSSAVPFTLEMLAMRSLSTRVFGVLMSLEPAVAAVCGMLILHEHLTQWQWFGLLAVTAASAGISLTSVETAPETEPVVTKPAPSEVLRNPTFIG